MLWGQGRGSHSGELGLVRRPRSPGSPGSWSREVVRSHLCLQKSSWGHQGSFYKSRFQGPVLPVLQNQTPRGRSRSPVSGMRGRHRPPAPLLLFPLPALPLLPGLDPCSHLEHFTLDSALSGLIDVFLNGHVIILWIRTGGQETPCDSPKMPRGGLCLAGILTPSPEPLPLYLHPLFREATSSVSSPLQSHPVSPSCCLTASHRASSPAPTLAPCCSLSPQDVWAFAPALPGPFSAMSLALVLFFRETPPWDI